MGRPKTEELISFRLATKAVKELTGVSRTEVSLWQWATQGRISKHGEIVKLRTVKRLNRYYTTKQWVEEFIREL